MHLDLQSAMHFHQGCFIVCDSSFECSCLDEWVEWALQGESSSSYEELGVEVIELGVLDAVKPDGLDVM